MKRHWRIVAGMIAWLAVVMASPPGLHAQEAMSKEQLEALVAPIALYPDSLLVQVLMASTYPLEVVQAARWAKANPSLKGDQLDAALEKENWDPSVKSLVNFPQVLTMMSDKLDWTQRLGDAMLGQQKEVMAAVQALRAKAKDSGNLQSTEQQKVVVRQETIVIEPAKPDVVYVPQYDTTVVYGAWPYPAYPPAPVYYPGYYPGAVAGAAAVGFATGVALTAAWGYAWGDCDWGHNEINIDNSKNVNYNKNINNPNRQDVQKANAKQGNWQHNPEHRKGVAYRDQNTAQRYGRGGGDQARARQEFRGHDPGSLGGSSQRPSAGTMDRPATGQRPAGGSERASGGRAPSAGTMDRPGIGQEGSRGQSVSQTGSRGGRSDAFGGMGSGSQVRSASSRGQQSRSGSFGGGSSRGGGRGGGGGRR